MAKEHIYTVDSGPVPDSFIVRKLDKDFRHLENISVSKREAHDRTIWLCSCYAQTRPDCRHRKMVRTFLSEGLVGSGKLLDFDKNVFIIQEDPFDENERNDSEATS